MNPVKPADDLSTYLADLLEGSYDCMDRITVNAFYPPATFAFPSSRNGDAPSVDAVAAVQEKNCAERSVPIKPFENSQLELKLIRFCKPSGRQ